MQHLYLECMHSKLHKVTDILPLITFIDNLFRLSHMHTFKHMLFEDHRAHWLQSWLSGCEQCARHGVFFYWLFFNLCKRPWCRWNLQSMVLLALRTSSKVFAKNVFQLEIYPQ